MKRDWDLIRVILLASEESADSISTRDITEWAPDLVNYHIEMLVQAGLVTGECTTGLGNSGTTCVVNSLTWAGHEFLDSIRSKTVWNSVKRSALDKGLSLSFDVVKMVAMEVVKSVILKS